MPRPGPGTENAYANPLRRAKVVPERIDQGVDYAGTGPIYALGAGRIVATRNAGWPGGAFIAERLGTGPYKGQYVYAAENITPTVQVGQQVTSQTQIGTITGGIETGFAAPPPDIGESLARKSGQWNATDPSTGYGVQYSNLLEALGAPAGIKSSNVSGKPGPPVSAPSGGAPGPGIPQQIESFLSGLPIIGIPFQFAAGVSDTAAAISGVAGALTSVAHWADWFLKPGHWVRIFCGVLGAGAVSSGVFMLSKTGGGSAGIPLTGVSVRPGAAALPVGIALTGGGSVLLFLAFHNLPSDGSLIGSATNVIDVPSLLAYLASALKNPSGFPVAPLTPGFVPGTAASQGAAAAGNALKGIKIANTAIVKKAATVFGWAKGQQLAALQHIIAAESGGNTQARNPGTGALGIAQALGHGGPDTAGTLGNEYGAQYGLSAAQAREANSGDALQQLRWMMGYIKARYGSPAAAWRFHLANNWY